MKDEFIYIGPIRDEEESIGPYFLSIKEGVRRFFRNVFIWKYSKNRDYLLRNIVTHQITDTDFEKILKGERIPHCTRCQYCSFLTCLTCTGGWMPPTPSPYSSPKHFESKWQNLVKNPISTTLTELQYNSLYRDFKDASRVPTQGPAFKERMGKLGGLVEEEMLKIVHTFTSEVFPTLVDEYLKLFEEMVKGLILLKETGITLEDICTIGEESYSYNYQQATKTTNMGSKLSSCRPYKAAEFEKLLLDELVKQHKTLRDISKINRKLSPNSIHNAEDNPDYLNPYLFFLLNCHNLPSCNKEEFGQILHVEKQMFLKNCLKLLRDNDYFRFHSQSEHFNAAAECTSPKHAIQQDINEDEMYKMSVRIYNKSIYHVQLAILAICRSMQYEEQGRKRLLPSTPNRTSNTERILKISESKNLIKKSLSDFLKPIDRSASSEDDVFIHKSKQRDSILQDGSTLKQSNETYKELQAMPSIKYENETKYEHKYGLKYETGYLPNEHNKQEFPPIRQAIVQQHPDPECTDAIRHTHKGDENTENDQKSDQNQNTEFLAHTQGYAGRTKIMQKKIHGDDDKIVRGIEAYILDRPLFRRKKNDVRIICVINYYEPEIPHFEAIAFLKKMETEYGILHYPHCSENTSLTKIDGPSFYLAVCCTDCRQELAPPQKLEAFKSGSINTHQSKMLHIIRKTSSYFPVKCGSCSFFLCDPQTRKKQHLYVPFHSSAKGYICASRLKSHVCETGSSDIEYTGCQSDAINNSNTHQIQKIIVEGTKRCQPHDFLNKLANLGNIARSQSLPILVRHKDNDFADMENDNKQARVNESLKYEDAVSDILNMWTYEMIDYEKGANSPHLKSQILNYRKSLSIFIKKDIREKLYYRHILSVFERVENYKSPILEFKNRISAQKSKMNCKIIRRSRSCHSKLRYEATSATHRRSDYESLGFYNNILNTRQLVLDSKKGVGSPYLSRKNIARPLSLHSELKRKLPETQRRRRSYSFTESVYKEDFFTEINAWKYELQELQKGIESPDLRSRLNRKNIARPLSLHSELKHKTLHTHGRRRSSCSFATESGFKDDSTQITVWKNELLKLQKSAESPHLGYEARSRYNMARPLSLHSEIIQKPATQRRRSYSLTDSECKEDLSTQINSWRNELQELQKSVERPYLRCGANRINYTGANSLHSGNKHSSTATTHDPNSESFINKFSAQINKSKLELLKLQRTLEIINHKNVLRTRGKFEPNQKSVYSHSQPEPAVNKDLELTAWEDELLNMQKNVDSPQVKPETLSHKIDNRAVSLEEEPKPTTSTNIHHPVSEVDDTLTELKTWNLKLRELERDATSPHLQGKKICRKIKTRAFSLQTEPERPTTLSRNRPKSESVLDDFSTELESWKHELLTLEEDATNPQPEPRNRKNIAKSHSLNSEPKYNTAVAHWVNFESMANKGDTARRHTSMAPTQTPPIPNLTRISPQNKSPVRRYSASPRQLPAIPNTRNARRHSHYETTGNFVNLLSDRRTTRLSTQNIREPATSNYGSEDQGFIHPPNEASEGLLRPDEGSARARFLSQ